MFNWKTNKTNPPDDFLFRLLEPPATGAHPHPYDISGVTLYLAYPPIALGQPTKNPRGRCSVP